MNYALILAGGTGQRMRTGGLPKQFLEASGKPIIVHTLEKFEEAGCIDGVVIPCNAGWIDHMNGLVKKYELTKVISVIPGGADRQASIVAGMGELLGRAARGDDIVLIHDGVRPLVDLDVIRRNCEIARDYGCAVTVRESVEGVVVTDRAEVEKSDFIDRSRTYTLTAPQSFRFSELEECYRQASEKGMEHMLDTALLWAELGGKLPIVVEGPGNLKITTPDDFYYFKARLELEESKRIWGM